MNRPNHPRSRTSHAKRSILGVALILLGGNAFGWTASGTVKSSVGAALEGVAISVQDSAALKTTTDALGAFTLSNPSTGVEGSAWTEHPSVRKLGTGLEFRCGCSGPVDASLYDMAGTLRWKTVSIAQEGSARLDIPSELRFGAGILRIRHASGSFLQPVTILGSDGIKVASHLASARALAVNPVLVFRKAGYADATYPMTSASQTGIAVTMSPVGADFVEDRRSECVIPAFPAASSLTTSNAKLPNPFKMIDGTPVTTLAQWKCRREEMIATAEFYELGVKPRNPEKVTGSFSGNTLTVTVTDKGKTLSFTVTISKPAGAGPFPAIIGFGGGNLGSAYSNMGVATINYTGTDLAADAVAHGGGKFYTMYGTSATAGSLVGWAWGISRVIDALAVTPSAGIDVKRLGVTGCSRYGKGALMAGVLDQRIALTISQEAGGGGCSAWRVIAAEKAAGKNIEQYDNLSTGTNWLGTVSKSFNNSTTGKLPHDHHWLMASIAPRGLLSIENTIDWLGPNASFVTNSVVHEIFGGVGAAGAHTYSLTTGHDHCALPQSQYHWVQSYVKKFLLGQTGEAAKVEAPASHTYDRTKWVDWTTPTLR